MGIRVWNVTYECIGQLFFFGMLTNFMADKEEAEWNRTKGFGKLKKKRKEINSSLKYCQNTRSSSDLRKVTQGKNQIAQLGRFKSEKEIQQTKFGKGQRSPQMRLESMGQNFKSNDKGAKFLKLKIKNKIVSMTPEPFSDPKIFQMEFLPKFKVMITVNSKKNLCISELQKRSTASPKSYLCPLPRLIKRPIIHVFS